MAHGPKFIYRPVIPTIIICKNKREGEQKIEGILGES